MVPFPIFLKGALIGLSVAAPVGPMAVLCVQRTLARGRMTGLMTGLGIALGDGLYAALAAFGWGFLSSGLLQFQDWLRLGAGLFLIALGAKTWSKPIPSVGGKVTKGDLGTALLSALLLTLSNPPTLLLFMGFFSTLGEWGKGQGAWMVTLGVLGGSLIWWLTLVVGVNLGARGWTGARLAWVNRLAGLTIAAFGLNALLSLMHR